MALLSLEQLQADEQQPLAASDILELALDGDQYGFLEQAKLIYFRASDQLIAKYVKNGYNQDEVIEQIAHDTQDVLGVKLSANQVKSIISAIEQWNDSVIDQRNHADSYEEAVPLNGIILVSQTILENLVILEKQLQKQQVEQICADYLGYLKLEITDKFGPDFIEYNSKLDNESYHILQYKKIRVEHIQEHIQKIEVDEIIRNPDSLKDVINSIIFSTEILKQDTDRGFLNFLRSLLRAIASLFSSSESTLLPSKDELILNRFQEALIKPYNEQQPDNCNYRLVSQRPSL